MAITNEAILSSALKKIASKPIGDCRVRAKSAHGRITVVQLLKTADSPSKTHGQLVDPYGLLDRALHYLSFEREISAELFLHNGTVTSIDIEFNGFSYPNPYEGKLMSARECLNRVQWFARQSCRESGEVQITTSEAGIVSIRGRINLTKKTAEDGIAYLDPELFKLLQSYIEIRNSKVVCYFEGGRLCGVDNHVREIIWRETATR